MTAVTAQFILRNPSGLHARPAATFVERAKAFESAVHVQHEQTTANGKSVLSLLKLGIAAGSSLTLSADGPDAEAAVDALVELLGVLDAETETH
jgi:phosphocarrier protein FPr